MTLYALKPRFQAVCRPLAGALVAHGVTANEVTIVAAALSVVTGATVMLYAESAAVFWLIPLVLLVRVPLNAIDGLMAREHGQQSALGAYLNELGDVISDAALMLPFAFVPPLSLAGIGSLVLLAVLAEFAGALALGIAGERQYQGPLGKSDRAVLLGLLGAWDGLGLPLPDAAVWAVPLVALLLVITLVNRVRAGLSTTARHRT